MIRAETEDEIDDIEAEIFTQLDKYLEEDDFILENAAVKIKFTS
jgi:hypothetical protein